MIGPVLAFSFSAILETASFGPFHEMLYLGSQELGGGILGLLFKEFLFAYRGCLLWGRSYGKYLQLTIFAILFFGDVTTYYHLNPWL